MTDSNPQIESESNAGVKPSGVEVGKGEMIMDDPLFDPAWDVKVAKQIDENTSGAAEKTAETPKTQETPVKKDVGAVSEKVDSDVPQFIKEQSKEKKNVPLPSNVENVDVDNENPAVLSVETPQNTSSVQKTASTPSVVPIPAPVKRKGKEVKKKAKFIWGDVLSCWVLGIGSILIVLLLLLFIIAKSGLVNIPFLSDWFYHAPLPSRFVVAGDTSWDEFRGLVTGRLIDEGLDSEPPIPLPISEQEFTELLHGVIADGLRSTEYKAEVAQVVITPQGVELYFYLTWHDYITFEILTHLIPVVEDDGTLRFEVADARFGDLPLPGLWVMRVIGYFFARDVGAWRIVLSNGYGIQSAVLMDQNIKLLIGPVLVE